MAVLYPDPTNWSEHQVPIGRERTYGEGTDLTIVTFGNGLHMSPRVARRLDRAQISTRVVDMRWLAPLPIQDIVREANAPAVSSSSTKPAAPAASPRASSPP